ncbi:MAG TPA: DUF4340 domain-containing protein [Steroidobacteraceae bacterium]|nr:DUF4340 domain-containing protein [Steroidobacteraceae bacterium]
MTGRRVALLAIAAAIIVGAAFWVSSPRQADEAALSGEKVLAGLEKEVNAVKEVRLSKGDGRRVTLRKRANDWVVAEREYRADSGRVRKLLLDLSALEVEEEKTRTAANYPQLGVEDVVAPNAAGTLVEVITPQKSFTLIVGKASGTKSSYVRVPQVEQSLLARPQLNLDPDSQRWIDRTLLDIPQDRIREVSVQQAGGQTYTVKRASKEQTDFAVEGVPKGRALSNPGAANGAAGALAGLTLDDVRPAAKAPADPKSMLTATFRTFDGLALEVSGHKEGERHFLTARAQSSTKDTAAEAERLNARLAGWEFEIPSYKYGAIFRPLEDLLARTS